VNNLNELTTITRAGTLTVAGTTTSPATNVMVNNLVAALYSDATFAKDGFNLLDGDNTFTAVAQDSYGRADTNTVAVSLPLTNVFAYDLNGNLLTNGTRVFAYDDENQLISVTEPGEWKAEFLYDGKMRRRIEKGFAWQGGTWVQTNEVRFVYDGNVVIQHRDANNLPQVTLTRGRDLSGSLQGAGGIGGLLARIENPSTLNNQPSTSYYHCDGNGNITALIDANQNIAAKYFRTCNFQPATCTGFAPFCSAFRSHRLGARSGGEVSTLA
jgi:YD repeat-containing protein